jgi:hypothetical protein
MHRGSPLPGERLSLGAHLDGRGTGVTDRQR